MRLFSVESESVHLLPAPQSFVLFSAPPSSAGYFYASIFGFGDLSALFCFSDDPFGSFFSFLPSILLRHKSEKPA